MERPDKIAMARSLNNPHKPPASDTGTLDKLSKRLAALEIRLDFTEDRKWDDPNSLMVESPWDDVCVRHGTLSYIAGVKDCPYPDETHAARRWTAGYSFAAYWKGIVEDELKDRVEELEGVSYEHSG